MAQSKKTGASKSKGAQTKKSTQNKQAKKNEVKSSLFNSDHKQIFAFVGFFVSLFMIAVVLIDAGSVWGALRNFMFGLFGAFAYIMPFFFCFISVVAAIGRDSRKYKIKVAESFVVFALFVGFLHIVNSNPELGYWEQAGENYNVFKMYDGSGMRYGYGVFGALVGGIPMLLTGFNKLAAGIITIILLIALIMIFSGTSILKLLQTLKGPAEAVTEYAEEKLDDFKVTYANNKEERAERRELKAKNAERSRAASQKGQISLDIPLDDEVFEDVGVDPILGDKEPENVTADDIIGLLNEENDDAPEEYTSLAQMRESEPEPELVEFVDVEDSFAVDSSTGEILDEAPASTRNVEELDIPEEVTAPQPEPVRVYELPPVDCLDAPKRNSKAGSGNELREKGDTIVKTLASFGVGTRIVEICQSPSVTRFELQPEPGVKISKITALADDIAMNLAASGVRIEAPIPNKNAVGIEVPNAEKAMVTLREIIDSDAFRNSKSRLNVALGRDIQGEVTCADLAKMPHLLVAGTTGSGKSVCLNTMIMSLLYNATPDEVKLIMIDPKKVEFTVYKSIPHLLVPVVADPRKAAGALSWAVAEMDKRYALFADNGVRNLQGYNTYAVSNNIPKMPQIVIIIDELSDLMMAASNEVEDSICRLAQKARAAGMHLIVATQRPSVDVITGLIKANIPSRIAFAVKSQIDSRTIIDTQGAEKLLGNGDMLYCPVGLSKPVRVQGAYVSDEEIERVIEFVTSQGDVQYDDSVMQEIEIKASQSGGKKKVAEVVVETGGDGDYEDEMIPKAIEVVVEAGMASTTLLQRKLKLGYARAARIVDELSEKGIIGPFEGSKPRKVLITKEQWYEMQANSSVSAPRQLSVDDLPVQPQPEAPAVNISENHNYFGSDTNTDIEG